MTVCTIVMAGLGSVTVFELTGFPVMTMVYIIGGILFFVVFCAMLAMFFRSSNKSSSSKFD